MEYSSAIKRNELLTHITKLINLKHIMKKKRKRKRSHTLKAIYYVIVHL